MRIDNEGSREWPKYACELFNRFVKPGSAVELTNDLGERIATKTKSEAWLLGDGTPVVKVNGVSGGYLLSRIRAIEESQDV